MMKNLWALGTPLCRQTTEEANVVLSLFPVTPQMFSAFASMKFLHISEW